MGPSFFLVLIGFNSSAYEVYEGRAKSPVQISNNPHCRPSSSTVTLKLHSGAELVVLLFFAGIEGEYFS